MIADVAFGSLLSLHFDHLRRYRELGDIGLWSNRSVGQCAPPQQLSGAFCRSGATGLASNRCHGNVVPPTLEAKVNRQEIEQRIWGKSITSARTSGLISEQEAKFLIEQYLREFRLKNGWDGKTYITPRIFF